MYALPEQTVEEAERDLRTAIAFAPPHLSAYHLTIEPNTLFHRRPPNVPDHDAAAQIHERVEAVLDAAGYRHYETSAYAHPGREARHNLNYWQFGDYLGIGAGAHSKLSFPDRIERSMRVKLPRDYVARASSAEVVTEQRTIAREELVFEFMMNALRLTDGVAVSMFTERTGLPITAASKPLARAEALGLIERDALRIQPTPHGRRFLNDLLELFLPE